METKEMKKQVKKALKTIGIKDDFGFYEKVINGKAVILNGNFIAIKFGGKYMIYDKKNDEMLNKDKDFFFTSCSINFSGDFSFFVRDDGRIHIFKLEEGIEIEKEIYIFGYYFVPNYYVFFFNTDDKRGGALTFHFSAYETIMMDERIASVEYFYLSTYLKVNIQNSNKFHLFSIETRELIAQHIDYADVINEYFRFFIVFKILKDGKSSLYSTDQHKYLFENVYDYEVIDYLGSKCFYTKNTDGSYGIYNSNGQILFVSFIPLVYHNKDIKCFSGEKFGKKTTELFVDDNKRTRYTCPGEFLKILYGRFVVVRENNEIKVHDFVLEKVILNLSTKKFDCIEGFSLDHNVVFENEGKGVSTCVPQFETSFRLFKLIKDGVVREVSFHTIS